MQRQKYIIAGLVCVAVIAAGALYIYKGVFRGQGGALATSLGDPVGLADVAVPPPLGTTMPVTPEATAGLRSYQNAAFHFGLLFPSTLVATEYKEANNAITVTFVNADNSQSFEVYVTPYGKTQIDAARFKLDEPSGVFLQPTNVVVGGTPATIFYGKNGIMGDTREVWFIHGGFLYEVATYKDLDPWLGGIMQSWKFF